MSERDTDQYPMFDALISRFYEPEPETRVEVEFGGKSDRGRVREQNEDHFLVTRRTRLREALLTNLPEGLLTKHSQDAYIIAVADGMGGHNHGDLASLMALQTGWYLGGNEIKWLVKVNEHERQEMEQKAEVFFQLINRAMHMEGMIEPRVMGMGTTLTICYSSGPELFVLNVGDSRAYQFHDGVLTQLTKDHTLSQRMIDEGVAERGSPEERRRRHVLTSSLGTESNVPEVSVYQGRVADSDVLLTCSDGLTDMVTDEEIANVLRESLPPQATCDRLVDLANERGGRDNITVVVGRYRFLRKQRNEIPTSHPGPLRPPSAG